MEFEEQSALKIKFDLYKKICYNIYIRKIKKGIENYDDKRKNDYRIKENWSKKIS